MSSATQWQEQTGEPSMPQARLQLLSPYLRAAVPERTLPLRGGAKPRMWPASSAGSGGRGGGQPPGRPSCSPCRCGLHAESTAPARATAPHACRRWVVDGRRQEGINRGKGPAGWRCGRRACARGESRRTPDRPRGCRGAGAGGGRTPSARPPPRHPQGGLPHAGGSAAAEARRRPGLAGTASQCRSCPEQAQGSPSSASPSRVAGTASHRR
mmetsp:Transcript_13039/g.51999  ORF Transcript_13039/g.51999 Transcript_13039/m.51999 type:complete len:212 (+) Transcript_13039:823-1458(+)